MCHNYHVNGKCFIHGRLVKSCLIDSNTSWIISSIGNISNIKKEEMSSNIFYSILQKYQYFRFIYQYIGSNNLQWRPSLMNYISENLSFLRFLHFSIRVFYCSLKSWKATLALVSTLSATQILRQTSSSAHFKMIWF